RAYRDTSDLHPEHPDVEGPVPSLSRGRSKKLPPPPPDYVWYKWKGEEYIGYDWRAAVEKPIIKQNYQRRQRRLANQRAAKKKRRLEKGPALSLSKGSLRFRGYRFLCPSCK